jgi:3-dehydroquinate dehydratase-2
MSKILVINGPNLGLLGKRETNIYGPETLDSINKDLAAMAKTAGYDCVFFQSDHEGDIIEKIGSTEAEAILINPAAYTHTSIAIRDALSAKNIPVVEVHISNIYAREEFRHKSLIAPVVIGQISGFGRASYTLGLQGLLGILNEKK